MSNPSEQLAKLHLSLEKLVAMLRLDARCQWTQKFESDLAMAKSLLSDDSSDTSENDLAVSIMYVFQGAGSFNDYVPQKYDPDSGRYSLIPGTEDFTEIAGQVFDLARQLRQ